MAKLAIAGSGTTPALDAISRIDDGTAQPADRTVAAIFDQHCRWEAERLDDQRREAEYTAWLAVQCPACEEGATGPACDDHSHVEACAALNVWHNR